MPQNSETKINPWVEIPLSDYEQHMSHSQVGQLGLLNSLTKKYLEKISPESCIFLGIAGGNGLEHIDNSVSKKVIAIDINQDYLDIVYKRFGHRITSLELLHINMEDQKNEISRVNFIWAGLIIEYIGISNCLEFAINNLRPDGHLIATIQKNNNRQSVTTTGIESIKKAGTIFQEVDSDQLIKMAGSIGLVEICRESNELPNGKLLLTFEWVFPAAR